MPDSRPAVLGGPPRFRDQIPLCRPTLEAGSEVFTDLAAVFASGMLTNSEHVREFERRVAGFLNVEQAVAVASCTAGLMLAFRCLGLEGEVVLPSFTFMASGHAVVWNGLTPTFADADERTFNLDRIDACRAISPRTSALSVTHVFGAPAEVDHLQREAETVAGHPLPVIVDAAHAFGARYPDGTFVGTKGTAEVFSFSPTKPLTTGEGGLVATDDASLAADLRHARDYGNAGNYDCVIVGLNARMTEMAAILGRHNLKLLHRRLARRRELARRYEVRLRELPGIGFQQIDQGAVATYKDLSVTVGEGFGLARDDLARALASEGIPTRTYFDPPLHRQTAYRAIARRTRLPKTDALSAAMLILPLSSHMPFDDVEQVCDAIEALHERRDDVATALGTRRPADRDPAPRG